MTVLFDNLSIIRVSSLRLYSTELARLVWGEPLAGIYQLGLLLCGGISGLNLCFSVLTWSKKTWGTGEDETPLLLLFSSSGEAGLDIENSFESIVDTFFSF